MVSSVALVSVTVRAKFFAIRRQAKERRKCKFVERLWVATVGAVGVMLTDSCLTETSGCQHALDEGVCGSGGVDTLILNFGSDWGQNLLD